MPCIGTNWGGVPEAVLVDQTAILVPVQNVPELTNAIRMLAGDVQVRSRMSQEGPKWASRNTWKMHADKLSNIILEAAG